LALATFSFVQAAVALAIGFAAVLAVPAFAVPAFAALAFIAAGTAAAVCAGNIGEFLQSSGGHRGLVYGA
jgi:hypothetical protein